MQGARDGQALPSRSARKKTTREGEQKVREEDKTIEGQDTTVQRKG